MRASRGVAAAVVLAIVAFLWWRTANAPTADDPSRDANPAGRTAAAPAADPGAPKEDVPSLATSTPKPVPPPPPAVPSGPHVTGRVVDAAGKAVAGARVVATSDLNSTTFDLGHAGSKGSPATATTSDTEGRFAIRVSEDAPFHYLFAWAEGHGFAVKPAVAPGADVVLSLPRATALAGTVKDREGKPVVGARIRLLLLLETASGVREVRSGEGGAYRLEGVPPIGETQVWRGFFARGWVEVLADGFAPLFVEAPSLPGSSAETRLDLVLSRGSVLVGRVVDDETDAPIEGATVVLQSREGVQGFGRENGVTFMNPHGSRTLFRATSVAAGAFRFEHVPCQGPNPSRLDGSGGTPTLGAVTAWKSGFALQGARVGYLADGAVQEAVIRLRPAGTVTGRVVEADGKPVAGAGVWTTVEGYRVTGSVRPLPEDAPTSWGTTDADGRFLLKGVPAKRGEATQARVEAQRPAAQLLLRRGPDTYPRAEARVEAAGATDVGDLRFDPAAAAPTTWVLVLDTEGRPVWGASVGQPTAASFRTGRDGRVAWPWPDTPGRASAAFDAVVRAAGFAPAAIRLDPPGTGPEPLEVRLERGRRVSGRVLRSDRTPAAGATVSIGRGSLPVSEVFPAPKAGGMAVYQSADMDPSRAKVITTTPTGDDGTFEATDLPAGPYHVAASLAKRVAVGADAAVRAIVSNVQSDATGVEIVLPADDSPATGRLEGRIEAGPGNERFESLRVTVRRGAEVLGGAYLAPAGTVAVPTRPGVSLASPDGRFVVESVPAGTVSIEVVAPGWRPHLVDAVEVRDGATTSVPTITLDRGVAAKGTLRAPSGVSWKGRRIWFRPEGDPIAAGVTAIVAEDGTFRASGLVPGRYRVESPGDTWRPDPEPPLLPTGTRVVVVTDDTSEIRFDADFLAAGTLSLAPMDPRLPPAPWGGKAATDEQTKFGAETRVRVTSADHVLVLDRKGVHQGGLLGNAGVLTLLPGRYVARIEYPGGGSAEETVTLEAGGNVSVFFRGR